MTSPPLLIVAGLSLKNLEPRVWDPQSPYFLPDLRAVAAFTAEALHPGWTSRDGLGVCVTPLG